MQDKITFMLNFCTLSWSKLCLLFLISYDSWDWFLLLKFRFLLLLFFESYFHPLLTELIKKGTIFLLEIFSLMISEGRSQYISQFLSSFMLRWYGSTDKLEINSGFNPKNLLIREEKVD